MRPACEVCGNTCTRIGWRGPVAMFTCSNSDCPEFGKRSYSVHEALESSEQDPDRKETE